MSAYLDSAVLVQAYCWETTSPEAVELIRRSTPPLPFTHLHALEIRNALRLKQYRREVTEAELAHALADLQDDVQSGLLEPPRYELTDVFQRAAELSDGYTRHTGARSLDVLHVAAALVLGCQEFVSFDRRQRDLALQAGLQVLPPQIPV